MAMVVVESPTKISKIQKILGPNYVVMASVGHLLQLTKQDNGVDKTTWTPIYEVSPDKKDIVKALKEEAKKHDVIYVCSDPDREGENLGFGIREILPKNKKIERASFNELTKSAIERAIQNPVGFNDDLNASQQARRIIDRITGFEASPILWLKGLRGASIGRVQSCILGWICDLEKEIRAFKKEEYWLIVAETKEGFSADFFGFGKTKFVPKNKEEAEQIVNAITGDLTVADYQAKLKTRSPSPPYITSTLQQDISTRFGWTTARVMDVAQSLFSKSLITYLRTDSTRIEPEKIDLIRNKIEQDFGKKYLHPTPRVYKNADTAFDAHEAIRWTFEPIPSDLSVDEEKLLTAIINRFMASQMSDAEYDSSAVVLEYKSSGKTYTFKANGSILRFDGFTKVYQVNSKDTILPTLKKGQKVGIKKLVPSQHFTKPKSRYSEAALVSEMKSSNVGRPSTYVAAIEAILKHNYVVREGKMLKPTEIGMLVSDYLQVYFSNITNTNFTAEMEQKLDLIAERKIQKNDVMEDFYKKLSEQIEHAKKDNPKEIFKVEIDCPDCKDGSKMIRKISEGAVFLSCQNYPKCGLTMNYKEDGSLVQSKVETALPCPECGSKLIEREGKFGKWLGCSGYPACKWTGNLNSDGTIKEKKKTETTDIKCDQCQDGMMVKREGRTGPFLGCSNFSKGCKNSMNLDANGNAVPKSKNFQKKKPAKGTGKTCPKCKKGELVERTNSKTQEVFIACNAFPKCKHIQK